MPYRPTVALMFALACSSAKEAPDSAAAAPVTDECGAQCAGMARIEAGSFRMGSPDNEGTSREHPSRIVTFTTPFWIDRYEVTNAQYAAFLKARGSNVCSALGADYPCIECFEHSMHDLGFECEDQSYEIKMSCQNTPDGRRDSSCADHPVVLVTWAGARSYCEALGKRLPTEAEWARAANGPGGERGQTWRRFSWGESCPASWNDVTLSACADVEWTRDTARANCQEAACADGFEGSAPIGSFPEGASVEGVMDLAGNVLERVEDCYHDSYTSRGAGSPPIDGSPWTSDCDPSLRVARSSSHLDPGSALRSRARTDEITIEAADPDVGFRCARSAL